MADTKRGRERSGKNKERDLIREDLERAKALVEEGEEEEDIFEQLDRELDEEFKAELEAELEES